MRALAWRVPAASTRCHPDFVKNICLLCFGDWCDTWCEQWVLARCLTSLISLAQIRQYLNPRVVNRSQGADVPRKSSKRPEHRFGLGCGGRQVTNSSFSKRLCARRGFEHGCWEDVTPCDLQLLNDFFVGWHSN